MKSNKSKRRKIIFCAALCLIAVLYPAPLQAKNTAGAVKTGKVWNVTEVKTYSKNVENDWYLRSVVTNNYNKAGYLFGTVSKYYKEDGSKESSGETKQTLDQQNRTSTYQSYTNGKLKTAEKYTYEGNKVIIKAYDINNKYTGKWVHTPSKSKWTSKSYDAKGKLTVESITTYKNGKMQKIDYRAYKKEKLYLTIITTYSYSGGYIKENISYKYKKFPESNFSEKAKYKTDKAGNYIYSWKKQYDAKGNVTGSSTFKNSFFKKGKAKGCLKQSIEVVGGRWVEKIQYKVKQFQRN